MIKVACAEQGITQAELSRRMGAARSSNWARWLPDGSSRIPNVRTLARIADALGLQLVIEFRKPG
jgi:transcriptional regulator with XRE-family HTH domain